MDNQNYRYPIDYNTNCPNRLECGVCLLIDKPCPLGFTNLEPTWSCSSTCSNAGFNSQMDERENEK